MNRWIKGWIAWLIISSIAVVFVFWGMSNYFGTSPAKAPVAKINGDEITYQEFSEIYQRYKVMQEDFLRQNNIPLNFNDQEIKEQALQSLIQNTVMRQNANAKHYGVSSKQVEEKLLSQQEFLDLNGQFSREKFEQAAYSLNLTPKILKDKIAEAMVMEQIANGISSTTFALPNEIDNLYRLQEQTRKIDYTIIPADKYLEQAKISEKAAQDFYNLNKAAFVDPEKVSIDYVELKLDDANKQVVISDDELRANYQDNLDQFTTPGSWHLAHILLTGNDKAKLANDIEKQLKAGVDFSALAKKYSDDSSTANSGGDLDWISPAELPESVQAALPTLSVKNTISKPIESRYGIHIVKYIDHADKVIKPFSEVKTQIKTRLQNQRSHEIFADMRQELENSAYENADSLKPVAAKLDLKLQTSNLFTEQGADSGIAKNKNIVAAAFSPEVLLDGNNSELIAIDDNKVAIIRINRRIAQSIKPYNSVKDRIKQQLRYESAAREARKISEKVKSDLKAGKSLQETAKKYALDANYNVFVKRNQDGGVNQVIVNETFDLDKPQLGQSVVKDFAIDNNKFAVVQLKDIDDGIVQKNDEIYSNYIKQLNGVYSQVEYEDYINILVDNSKIKKYENNMS